MAAVLFAINAGAVFFVLNDQVVDFRWLGGLNIAVLFMWWASKFAPKSARLGPAELDFQQKPGRRQTETINGESINSLLEKSNADSTVFETEAGADEE